MKSKYVERLNTVVLISASLFSAGVLISSLFAFDALGGNNYETFRILYGLSFILLALARIPLGIFAIRKEPNKIVMIKNFVFSFIYVVMGVLLFAFGSDLVVAGVASAVYLLVAVANRICICFEKKKVSSIVINSILAGIGFMIAIGFFIQIYDFIAYSVFSLGTMMVISFFETIIFAFSKMKLKGIVKIIRKTYALEVLYALFILVFVFSAFFYLTEESMKTYGDALWYSFAVVTTIGFGDISVTSPVSRVLSVVLGLYGIIVVAVITSVIVNYYNEVKNKIDTDEIKEEPKEIEKKDE